MNISSGFLALESGNIIPCLKLELVRVIPETFTKKYTRIYIFNFSDVKKSTFIQSNSMKAVLEILYFCLQFW